jgi:hypothetical protein
MWVLPPSLGGNNRRRISEQTLLNSFGPFSKKGKESPHFGGEEKSSSPQSQGVLFSTRLMKPKMKVVIATAVILNTMITSSLAQHGSEANDRTLRQSKYLRQSKIVVSSIYAPLVDGGGRRRIQDLSTLATWDKEPLIDPMISSMSLSMSIELTIPTYTPTLLPDDIFCTWKKWFKDDVELACSVLNDGYHIVPYTCDGEYPNVCCSESSILNPQMKLFGTCYKTDSVRDINSIYHSCTVVSANNGSFLFVELLG